MLRWLRLQAERLGLLAPRRGHRREANGVRTPALLSATAASAPSVHSLAGASGLAASPTLPRSLSTATPTPTPTAIPDFTPFAQALGVAELASPPPLSVEEAAEEARLAGLVLERFAASRPEPASFPAIALQVLNLVASPRVEVAELARFISRDPALSAGVLSVANSAFYRGLMEVETVRDAITRLGLHEVARVAAAVSARTLFSPRRRAENAVFGARWAALFGRAVAVASASAGSALRLRGARADRVYLGGLLHDVGKSLGLGALAGLVVDGRVPQPDAERLERILDATHVKLGAEAHQAWALPHYLTVICVRHHEPVVEPDPDLADLHLVRLTSALADVSEGSSVARAAGEIAQSAGALGLRPQAVRALSADLRQAMERARASFAGAFATERRPPPTVR